MNQEGTQAGACAVKPTAEQIARRYQLAADYARSVLDEMESCPFWKEVEKLQQEQEQEQGEAAHAWWLHGSQSS